MRQCPKCSRTYENDRQKFCTKDGTALIDVPADGAGQGETVQFDSSQLDDEVTKVISHPLPRMTGSGFDPYKTVMSAPEDRAMPPVSASQPVVPPAAPQPIQPIAAPPAAPTSPPQPAAPPPTSSSAASPIASPPAAVLDQAAPQTPAQPIASAMAPPAAVTAP